MFPDFTSEPHNQTSLNTQQPDRGPHVLGQLEIPILDLTFRREKKRNAAVFFLIFHLEIFESCGVVKDPTEELMNDFLRKSKTLRKKKYCMWLWGHVNPEVRLPAWGLIQAPQSHGGPALSTANAVPLGVGLGKRWAPSSREPGPLSPVWGLTRLSRSPASPTFPLPCLSTALPSSPLNPYPTMAPALKLNLTGCLSLRLKLLQSKIFKICMSLKFSTRKRCNQFLYLDSGAAGASERVASQSSDVMRAFGEHWDVLESPGDKANVPDRQALLEPSSSPL